MNTEISVLRQEIQHYQTMANECADIIQNLTGFPPNNPITILLRSGNVSLANLTVTEQGAGNFTLSLFMSWHSYYCREIDHKSRVLAALEAQYPIAC
jgi:hypothetical protein